MGKKGERYEVVSPYDENGLFILKNKQKSKMIIHYLQCKRQLYNELTCRGTFQGSGDRIGRFLRSTT